MFAPHSYSPWPLEHRPLAIFHALRSLLDAEIKVLRSEVAELRAVFRARPMTDEEVADPSAIPANASFDFGDVDVDLEGLSEDDMKAWTLNYIDAQAIPPARPASRKHNGRQHEQHA